VFGQIGRLICRDPRKPQSWAGRRQLCFTHQSRRGRVAHSDQNELPAGGSI